MTSPLNVQDSDAPLGCKTTLCLLLCQAVAFVLCLAGRAEHAVLLQTHACPS